MYNSEIESIMIFPLFSAVFVYFSDFVAYTLIFPVWMILDTLAYQRDTYLVYYLRPCYSHNHYVDYNNLSQFYLITSHENNRKPSATYSLREIAVLYARCLSLSA